MASHIKPKGMSGFRIAIACTPCPDGLCACLLQCFVLASAGAGNVGLQSAATTIYLFHVTCVKAAYFKKLWA